MRAALALVVLLCAGSAVAAPPVWTVRDRDSTLVLFGGLHVLPAGMDWAPPSLLASMRTADDIWFELPQGPAADAATRQAVEARGYLPKGRRLSDLLSAQGRDRLGRVAGYLRLDRDSLERMKPWLAEATLGSAVYGHSGATASTGVEGVLAARAPAKARLRAFETPPQQIAMFDAAPIADQVASLEDTLRQIEQSPGEYQAAVRAWMEGDVGAIDRRTMQPLKRIAPRLYAALVSRRNARWTMVLRQRLRGSGDTVVVVGIAHLIGPDGVPARLRAAGYHVEGP